MKSNWMILTMMSAIMLTSPLDIAKAQTRAFHNVEFAKAPTVNGETKGLSINIWKGVGEDPQPVVLFVHGGAWEGGDNNLERSGSEQIRAIMSLREQGVTIAAAIKTFILRILFSKK